MNEWVHYVCRLKNAYKGWDNICHVPNDQYLIVREWNCN